MRKGRGKPGKENPGDYIVADRVLRNVCKVVNSDDESADDDIIDRDRFNDSGSGSDFGRDYQPPDQIQDI